MFGKQLFCHAMQRSVNDVKKSYLWAVALFLVEAPYLNFLGS